jgi:hypothetical protein
MPAWTCNVNIPATIGRILEIDADSEPTADQVIAALMADEDNYLEAKAGQDFDYDTDTAVLSVEVLD